MVPPAEAGEHGLAVGGLGHVYGLGAELVDERARVRTRRSAPGAGSGAGLRPQGGHRVVIEHQIAADAGVMSPAHLGQDGLAVGGLGHVYGLGTELMEP